ncbi:MAG: imidazolonepropionase, partial [Bacteroidota bacterium]|nr:imidazolonepropionase [Bacteroidota bacterium]
MATQIYTHISGLLQAGTSGPFLRGKDLARLPVIKNAYVIIEGDQIAAWGRMEDFPYPSRPNEVVAPGTFLLPAWCDSHT